MAGSGGDEVIVWRAHLKLGHGPQTAMHRLTRPVGSSEETTHRSGRSTLTANYPEAAQEQGKSLLPATWRMVVLHFQEA
jgi:hypothetical protein